MKVTILILLLRSYGNGFFMRLELLLPLCKGGQMAGENLASVRGEYCSYPLDLRVEIAGKI